jgi:hypothetical protein
MGAESRLSSRSTLTSAYSSPWANEKDAAGGAVVGVAAGGICSGVHGLSGRTGRRQRDRVRQNRIDLSNVATHECECMSMYDDEGRVVPDTMAVPGYSVSSAVKVSTLRADVPARGVMGGLVQPATPPVEPPVSSPSDPFTGTTTTAPAPIDVQARGVSPRTDVAQAA